MKEKIEEIIKEKEKELEERYDYYLNLIDNNEKEWLTDRLFSIRSKINMCQELLIKVGEIE